MTIFDRLFLILTPYQLPMKQSTILIYIMALCFIRLNVIQNFPNLLAINARIMKWVQIFQGELGNGKRDRTNLIQKVLDYMAGMRDESHQIIPVATDKSGEQGNSCTKRCLMCADQHNLPWRDSFSSYLVMLKSTDRSFSHFIQRHQVRALNERWAF